MLYVLCYPALAPDAAGRIEAFRRVHEPARADLVRAHVTLVFGVHSIGTEDLASRTAALAGPTAPFDVSLDRVEVHEDHESADHKLFLAIGRGGDTLAALHCRLYAGTLGDEPRADMPFSPHMTVATAASPGPIRTAREAARDLGLPIAGRIDVLYVARLEEGRLDHVARFALGAAGEGR